METGKLVKNRKNHNLFEYDGKTYKYDDVFNLIKDLSYHTTGLDCDWQIIRVHDLSEDKDCFCLIFQESTSKTDWLCDFLFFPKKVKICNTSHQCFVFHKGFYEQYNSAKDDIKENLTPLLKSLAEEEHCLISDLKLYVMGWSLGAFIAQIAMWDMFETYKIKSVLISYEGGNPCYNRRTRNYLMNCLNEKESITFVYSNDIVPRLPPIFGKPLKDIRFYLNDHKCAFPFYIIKKIISFIKDTEYYHNHVDEGINNYMNKE